MPEPIEDPEVERRRARAMRHLARAFGSTDSYALVLLLIVVTYAIAVNVNHRGLTALVLIQVVTVRLALRTSVAHRRVLLAADVLFGVAVAAAVANFFVKDSTRLEPYMFVAATILYFIAPIAIVRRIAFRREVDQETMLGALAAYLFFGMAFAFTYRYIGAVQNTPFFGTGGIGSLSDDLFFSFVTLTTTGYGNLVPASNPGQSLAVFEALLGQLFLITAVGKIVTAWRPKGWRDEPTADPDPSPS
jgi:voltage-gated potassium channel Kch